METCSGENPAVNCYKTPALRETLKKLGADLIYSEQLARHG